MRPIHTWIVFGLCLALLLAAMAWISFTALRLDRTAGLEEKVRLALWRMESALGPLIAQESARPYFTYSAFYPAERAYTRMFAEIKGGDVLVPSPLLTEASPYILLHFQFGPDGELTSPQVPTGNMRDLAETTYTTRERIETAALHLADLRKRVGRDDLMRSLPDEEPQPALPAFVAVEAQGGAPGRLDEQAARNDYERQARFYNQEVLQSNVRGDFFRRSLGVREGPTKPLWVGSALVLARRVSVSGQDYVQGCWLDWSALRLWLLSGVKDLLPAADLRAAGSERGYEEARVLAALPAKLVPGLSPPDPASGISPVRLSLLIAWSCVLVAAVAVAGLLLGTLSLSERRAAFVSAVTHELRTPLTTLRMYTEMLEEGIVSGKEKTQRYLSTLRIEADRLAHLVENVLGYARLESRRADRRVETISLQQILDRVTSRLVQRAEQAGMKLAVEIEREALSACVRADTSAVEHILFNLVDNACKYAASASNRVIHLQSGRDGRFVSLRVRDHGPGISKRDARLLFRPFCKSARDVANHAPGVGLGLALGRRLARSMGGDLRLDRSVDGGACFVLTLPADVSAGRRD